MSTLKTLREELIAAVTADITKYTHVPGRLALPGIFVMSGSPYIEQGQTLGERLIRFDAVVAAQTATNQAETEAVDTLIESIVADLEADEWLVEQVSQPYSMAFNNADALVVAITVSTTIPTFTK